MFAKVFKVGVLALVVSGCSVIQQPTPTYQPQPVATPVQSAETEKPDEDIELYVNNNVCAEVYTYGTAIGNQLATKGINGDLNRFMETMFSIYLKRYGVPGNSAPGDGRRYDQLTAILFIREHISTLSVDVQRYTRLAKQPDPQQAVGKAVDNLFMECRTTDNFTSRKFYSRL